MKTTILVVDFKAKKLINKHISTNPTKSPPPQQSGNKRSRIIKSKGRKTAPSSKSDFSSQMMSSRWW